MAHTSNGCSILVIDDDNDFREPLRTVLEAEGYRVRCAREGEEGLRLAVEQPPDLILLDLMMPGKDGFAASHELRQIPAVRDVPVIALTSFGRDIGEIYGDEPGQRAPNVRECLEKPIEFNVLLDHVRSAIASHAKA